MSCLIVIITLVKFYILGEVHLKFSLHQVLVIHQLQYFIYAHLSYFIVTIALFGQNLFNHCIQVFLNLFHQFHLKFTQIMKMI